MTDNETATEEHLKLYSQKAIMVSTFLGSPLAAGVLVRQNFINLGKSKHGSYAILIGVLSTILIFTPFFLMPEHIAEKIPRYVIPAIYTGIVYWLVERQMGSDIKAHEENGGAFYSGWKAAGIVLLCLVLIFGVALASLYPTLDDFDAEKYDQGIEEFNANEEQALRFFDVLQTAQPYQAANFIEHRGIPSWQENIEILNELDQLDGLDRELIEQNQRLREYCELRIESYNLMVKALRESTGDYDQQIDELRKRIEDLIDQL